VQRAAEKLKEAGLLDFESEGSIVIKENVKQVAASHLLMPSIGILQMIEASLGTATSSSAPD